MQATNLNPDRLFLLQHIGFDKKIVAANGVMLSDEDNNSYVDFLAQYGAVPFGYNPDFLWRRLQQIQTRQEPSMVQPLLSPAAEQLASKLVEIAPGNMTYCTFTNSGAESVEAAIKLARAKTQKSVILSTSTGFHGKTLGAVSATGNTAYREPFIPDTRAFDHIPFNDLHALSKRLAEGDVAAFMVEPIQGEAGMIVAEPHYLRRASQLCKQHGVLFIVDEIQTGMGRTGNMFALDAEKDVHVDILLLAKALGGGLVSLGAVLCRKEVWSTEFGYLHSSTFANNHLSCSVALAVIEQLQQKQYAQLKHVNDVGSYLGRQLYILVDKYPGAFTKATGKGLMWGLTLKEWSGEQSYLMALASNSGHAVPLVCGYLLNQHKILTAPVFNNSNVLRIEPPLIINKQDIDKLIKALDQVGAAISKENYYELFSHISGHASNPQHKLIRKMDFSKPKSIETNIAAPDSEKRLGKFAFLIHPTEFDDLINCQPPAFDFFDAEQEQQWRQWLASWVGKRYEPGVVYHISKIRSKQGGYAEGWLIACPLTPVQMMKLRPAKKKQLIAQYIQIARELNVDILGLGAFTSVITRAGMDLANCGINITTGNSLTAMASAESLLLAAQRRNLDVSQESVGIVGAAGSVGRIVSKRLAGEAGQLVLFGNPKNPKSVEKLETFAGELYRESIYSLTDKKTGIGKRLFNRQSLGDWLSQLEPYIEDTENNSRQIFTIVNAVFDSAHLKPPVLVSNDLNQHLTQCQLLVSATSQGRAFIDPRQLANQAIVCDAARPPDVRRDVNAQRNNVLVYEGGLINLPENIRFGKDNVIGLPDGINLACLSETIALAFSKPDRNFSVGLDVPLTEAQTVYNTALSHGFEIALLDSDGVVDPLAVA